MHVLLATNLRLGRGRVEVRVHCVQHVSRAEQNAIALKTILRFAVLMVFLPFGLNFRFGLSSIRSHFVSPSLQKGEAGAQNASWRLKRTSLIFSPCPPGKPLA